MMATFDKKLFIEQILKPYSNEKLNIIHIFINCINNNHIDCAKYIYKSHLRICKANSQHFNVMILKKYFNFSTMYRDYPQGVDNFIRYFVYNNTTIALKTFYQVILSLNNNIREYFYDNIISKYMDPYKIIIKISETRINGSMFYDDPAKNIRKCIEFFNFISKYYHNRDELINKITPYFYMLYEYCSVPVASKNARNLIKFHNLSYRNIPIQVIAKKTIRNFDIKMIFFMINTYPSTYKSFNKLLIQDNDNIKIWFANIFTDNIVKYPEFIRIIKLFPLFYNHIVEKLSNPTYFNSILKFIDGTHNKYNHGPYYGHDIFLIIIMILEDNLIYHTDIVPLNKYIAINIETFNVKHVFDIIAKPKMLIEPIFTMPAIPQPEPLPQPYNDKSSPPQPQPYYLSFIPPRSSLLPHPLPDTINDDDINGTGYIFFKDFIAALFARNKKISSQLSHRQQYINCDIFYRTSYIHNNAEYRQQILQCLKSLD